MPITQVGTAQSTGSAAATTSVVVTKPPGVASGDWLFASVSSNARDITSTGWTVFDAQTNDVFRNTILYKAAGGSEPANYTFTAGAGTNAPMVATIIALAGVDTANPFNDHVATNSLTEAEPATGPSITTTGSERTRVMYLRAVRDDTATPITFTEATAGVSELADAGGFSTIAYSHGIFWDDADNTTSGSKSGLAITASSTETHNVERTWALNAADPYDTETGTVSESESISGTLTDSDSGTITESERIDIPIVDSDSGTITESESIQQITQYLVSDNFNREAAEDTTIRVMSFNIHHGAWPDDPTVTLETVRDAILASGADIIGLNEVDKIRSRSSNVDQAAWLANELGFFYAFGENVVFPGDGTYGNAILSRYPITSVTNTLLSSPSVEQRGMLVANITVHGVDMRFAVAHLDASLSGTIRQTQTTEIVSTLGASSTYTVLMGDMNAEPGTTEINTLTAAFLDTWAEEGVGNGYTFPGNAPTKRIDYVFVSDDLFILTVEVIDDTVSDDHLPYRADISAFSIPPETFLDISSSGHEWTNV